MDALATIRTVVKAKLPRGLSYPLGSEEMSPLLASVVDPSLCELTFADRAVFRHSQWLATVSAGGELPLLECRRPNSSAPWTVRVYALPSQHRARAHEQLLVAMAGPMRRWLSGSDPWRFVAIYTLRDAQLRVESVPRVDG